MTEDRPAEYNQKIQDLEDSLLRQNQLYFDRLNQFAKDIESSLESVNQYAKDLNEARQQNQALEVGIHQYSKDLNEARQQNQALEVGIHQYSKDLNEARQQNQALEVDIQQLKDQLRMQDNKISELNQFLDVNYLAIQQAQEELELCHVKYIKNRDDLAKSIKKQMLLLANTIINRSRKLVANLLPYRVLRKGKGIVDRWNYSL